MKESSFLKAFPIVGAFQWTARGLDRHRTGCGQDASPATAIVFR